MKSPFTLTLSFLLILTTFSLARPMSSPDKHTNLEGPNRCRPRNITPNSTDTNTYTDPKINPNPGTNSGNPPEPPSLADSLFPPTYTYSLGFTTAADVTVSGVTLTQLADKPLNVIKVSSGLTHNVVQQAGKTAWEAFYPAGSYNPSATPRGGFGFYLNGTNSFKQAIQGGATEVMVGYSIMFQQGWQWVKGGKIPGGFGGISDSAYGCSGGRQEDRQKCFNLRLMWRENGAGELYTYLPLNDQNADVLLAVPPQSFNNPDFGISVGRGAFTFPAGEWVTIAERIKLNDPASFDGEIQIWANGEKVIDVQGVSLRNSTDSVIQGMHFQTFFGGSTVDWATPVDQLAWFADVSGAIITGHA